MTQPGEELELPTEDLPSEILRSDHDASEVLKNAEESSGADSPLVRVEEQPGHNSAREGLASREWLASRGFSSEYNMHFNNREFLEREAKNGDALAAQLLGYQMLGSPRGDELLTDAARWGSIQALFFLSSSSEIVSGGRLKNQRESQISEQDQHEHSLRALEYLFVAEIRGDNYAAPNTISRLMDRNSYTEQDIAQVCIQSVERYQALEQARLSEGLPPFDNSSPQGINVPTSFSGFCPSLD